MQVTSVTEKTRIQSVWLNVIQKEARCYFPKGADGVNLLEDIRRTMRGNLAWIFVAGFMVTTITALPSLKVDVKVEAQLDPALVQLGSICSGLINPNETCLEILNKLNITGGIECNKTATESPGLVGEDKVTTTGPIMGGGVGATTNAHNGDHEATTTGPIMGGGVGATTNAHNGGHEATTTGPIMEHPNGWS
nr:expressed protein [Hymenolepis microstoma]